MSVDVIIVGSRVAGAATGMLLARAGLRVLVVDQAHFPSDTLSTHQIQVPGRRPACAVRTAAAVAGCGHATHPSRAFPGWRRCGGRGVSAVPGRQHDDQSASHRSRRSACRRSPCRWRRGARGMLPGESGQRSRSGKRSSPAGQTQRPADDRSLRRSSSEQTESTPRSLSWLARPSVAGLLQGPSPSTGTGTACRSRVAKSTRAPDSQRARGRPTTASR